MFKKSILALSALSMVAVPAAAEAKHRHGGYTNDGYAQGYYPQQQQYGYSNGYYPQQQQQQAYGYNDGYYGQSNGYRQRRCSGTTGTIVGAGAGALIGRSIGRSGGDYYNRPSGTTGTILGAAVGALLGRQVGKSTC